MNVEQFGLVAQTLYLIAQQLSKLAVQNYYKDRQIEELKQQVAASSG